VAMFDRRLGSLAQTPLSRGRCQISTMRIILIESRALLRGCMQHTLSTFLPEAEIECANYPHECNSNSAQLLLVGLDPRFDCGLAQLDDMFRTLREGGATTPIGIYLHTDDPLAVASLARFDVAGILSPSSGLDLVIAAVRLMAVGGTFLPSEILRAGAEVDAGFLAPELAPEAISEDCSAMTPARANQISFNDSTGCIAVSIPSQMDITPSKSMLTIREEEVLKSLRAGRQNKIIAHELGISESTVKVHLRNIMKKLKVSNRTQAALRVDATRFAATQYP
jgi:DNA-binding NarL/FixJ family response regulator